MVYALWLIMRAALTLGVGVHEPDLWQQLDLEQALAQAKGSGRPVLVYFASPVCPASHRMDTHTWPDPDLKRVMREDFVAIRPETTPSRDLDQRLGVIGYPTLIRLESGNETARLVGFWEPDRVLTWLDEPGSLVPEGDPRTMALGDVHDLAMDRLLAGQPTPAGEAMIVFWERSAAEPEASDTLRWLRRDRYPSLLKKACEDPATREKVEARAQSLGDPVPSAQTHPSLVRDWVVLMLALGEDRAVLDWAESRLADSPDSLRGNEPLYDHLLANGRLREAGLVIDESMRTRWLARLRGEPVGEAVSDAAPARVASNERHRSRERLEAMCRALQAAGRTAEARALEGEAGLH
ncbi:MAG: thioredoxin family protein [Phycisphaerales bacterium JB058]